MNRHTACPWPVWFRTGVLLTVTYAISSTVAVQDHACSQELPAADALPPAPGQSVEDRQQRFLEVLALADWDESRLSKFADREPLSADEQLEIWRFIERLAMLDPVWMHRQYGRDVTPRELVESPGAYRGQLVRLRGSARKVEVDEPSPEDRKRLSIESFYRTTIEVDGMPIVVTTPEVPGRWKDLVPLDQPAEVSGILVKLASGPLGEATPYLVATRIAWFPTQVELPTVNYGMSILGILDIDVATFDRLLQRRSLTRQDAPAFYQVLAGLGRSSVRQLQGAADRQLRQLATNWEERLAEAEKINDPKRARLARTVIKEAEEGRYSVAPFFNTPHEQVGQIASFKGVVRSALRVEVEPQTAYLHGGLDHYYQLALFTPDSQNYPIFFCVRALPDGFPLGEDVNVTVRIAGFFLKMWQYRSRTETDETGGRGPSHETVASLQAPLFVGITPEVISPPSRDRSWGYAAAGGIVLLLACVCVIEWVRNRRDRYYANTTLARIQRSAMDLDFDRLESQAGGMPNETTSGEENQTSAEEFLGDDEGPDV